MTNPRILAASDPASERRSPSLGLSLGALSEDAVISAGSALGLPLMNWETKLDLTCVWYQTDAGKTPGYKGCASSCQPDSGGEAHDVLPASLAKRSRPPADVAALNLSA